MTRCRSYFNGRINRYSKQDGGETVEAAGNLCRGGGIRAGVVAGVTEQRVEVGTDGDVVLGAINTTTTLVVGSYNGAFGVSEANIGSGAGVVGEARNSAGYGVFGNDASTILPMSACSVRVRKGRACAVTARAGLAYRLIPSLSSANPTAIYGVNNSSYTGSVTSAGGFGILGLSQNGDGLMGRTNATGAAAAVGSANGVAGAWAGIFYGPTIVEGNFAVLGGAKSAAVPHPHGTYRRLYCVESPESWFEIW
jgi:hypothetical protein